MIVLDANILIRAVLGRRVRSLLSQYESTIRFLVPAPALLEVDANLPIILMRRGISYDEVKELIEVRNGIELLIERLPIEVFLSFKDEALARLRRRDPDDWHVLAAALAFDCPIWTEDMDFFGVGVATWTTDNIEIHLRSRAELK